MSSTFLSLHYHIVFSTKERCPFLRETWRDKMHEYLGGTVRGLGGIPEAIGGVADHVHLLVGLRATHCLADFMQELKKATSVWAKDNHEPSFGWQDGYAAFTVSYTHIDPVKDYIRTQEEHHQQTDFIEELKRLLEKNGVEYKPEYLV
jgi:REP element-mobilizing transposase RayT